MGMLGVYFALLVGCRGWFFMHFWRVQPAALA
jgi:hypothetical protein